MKTGDMIGHRDLPVGTQKKTLLRRRVANQYLDVGSMVIIIITLVLFVLALFMKGFTQDLLLASAVFLVSVKLIRMAHRISKYNDEIMKQMKEIKDAIGTQ
jgi:hypothetical protein